MSKEVLIAEHKRVKDVDLVRYISYRVTLCFDIETFSFVVVAHLNVIGEHCYVSPISGKPVGVVISFLRTFITAASSICILAGVNSCLPFQVLISRE